MIKGAAITADLWHLQHHFVVNGLQISSRMTVVRLNDASLWLHSPVPLSAEVRAQLATLGTVRYRLLVRDRQAARESAKRILALPFVRVVVAHNAIIEVDAHDAVEHAFAYFLSD